MVVPFNQEQQIHGRYQLLSSHTVMKQLENEGTDMSRYDGQEYANFMKSLNTGMLKPQDKLTRPKNTPANLRAKSPKPQKQNPTSMNPLSRSAPSSLQINEIKKQSEEQHKKQMKKIDDYMFGCKQQERELKRTEGDIIKNEQNLKKAMRSYEADIYNEKRQQEKQLQTADKEQEKIKKQFNHEEEKIIKDRINRNVGIIQKEKENESKVVNNLNGLEFEYASIAQAIDLKRQEVNGLVKDFELKVKQKEEEEFRLKKEFADIALKLNMEAQKQRVQKDLDNRNNQSIEQKDILSNKKRDEDLKDKIQFQKERVNQAEKSKRRLSMELNGVKSTLSMQEREEGRRLMDVKSKLYDNSINRKEAKIKADLVEMDRQGALSEEKVLAVNVRRQAIQDIITQQRKQKNDLSMDEFRRRHFIVNHAQEKQNLNDNISHFKEKGTSQDVDVKNQKTVNKSDEREHNLYNQARQYESERRKQEQNVLQLREELNMTQKQNKALLKETALRCQKQEYELQQKLIREQAMLGKALNEREECISSLIKCRNAGKEDKHMLQEQTKIQDRLQRIEQKSTLLRHEQQQQQDVY